MAERGFVAWWPHDKLSVRGYFEVLGHFREILAIRSRLVERLLADKPDAFIGVDAPDFNLGVETKLKAAGVKTIHFVSPSIWAWRGNRIAGIGRATDLVLCIFPFEPEIYAKRDINAVYVGHPLASAIPFEVPRGRCARDARHRRRARRWWRSCRAAAAPRSATSRRACSPRRPR